MIPIRFLETHTEIFHAGKNHGKKFSTDRPTDKILEYNPETKEFCLTWNNRKAYIPMHNVVIYEPVTDVPVIVPKNEHHTQDTRKIKTAQVSTPMGHVFEGPGRGKKRD